MKIEICEQMIESWLTHIMGCQIVQINWTPPSLLEFSSDDIKLIECFINDVREVISAEEIDIFEKSTVSQFVSQTEIDVVGIKILGRTVEAIYLVDSAFHEFGLGYKNPTATILKKLLRMLVVSNMFFKHIPSNIIFVSPYARESVSRDIDKNLNELQPIIVKYFPDMKVELIFNEQFANHIYKPLVENIDKFKNDNALFTRSLKLANICERFMGQEEMISNSISNPLKHNLKNENATRKPPRGENKKAVFSALRKIISLDKMSESLLVKLQNCEYTHRNFKIPKYPFLITQNNFNEKGYKRKCFYKPETIKINGQVYFVCSQWIPERIKELNIWLKQFDE